jgi:hypothetical protein
MTLERLPITQQATRGYVGTVEARMEVWSSRQPSKELADRSPQRPTAAMGGTSEAGTVGSLRSRRDRR